MPHAKTSGAFLPKGRGKRAETEDNWSGRSPDKRIQVGAQTLHINRRLNVREEKGVEGGGRGERENGRVPGTEWGKTSFIKSSEREKKDGRGDQYKKKKETRTWQDRKIE